MAIGLGRYLPGWWSIAIPNCFQCFITSWDTKHPPSTAIVPVLLCQCCAAKSFFS